jgi:multidrug resistance efflux pump
MAMNICSPKDGFVIKLLVHEGSKVDGGAALLEMDNDWEMRSLESLRVREAVRQINYAQYTGEQLDFARSIAKTALVAAETQRKLATKLRDLIAKQISVGTTDASQHFQFDMKQTQPTFDRDRALSDQKQLEYSIERHTKIHELAKGLNEYKAAYLKGRMERLKISAPISGHVKLRVQQGSFAELGSTLLEIA